MKSSLILNRSRINAAAAGSTQALLEFDRWGLPPAPGEDHQAFAERLQKLADALTELENQLRKHPQFEVAPGIKIAHARKIPPAICEEALQQTQELYDVRPEWVPGFFANESFGMLWGGCALSDPESNLVLFIIRKIFSKKRCYLVYDRQELMAHELTHAAHQALNELKYEEYFAYRTAHSPLRKLFGGCFVRKYDAWAFLLPILMLPVAQMLNLMQIIAVNMSIFYLIAAIVPCGLAIRCLLTARTANRARKFLLKKQIRKPDAVLFRLTAKEIKVLSAGKMPIIRDLRSQILAQYFPAAPENM